MIKTKMFLSFFIIFSLLINLVPSSLTAQTNNPLSLPLYNGSGMVYKGSFTYDWPDGAGGDISYGGSALGVSEDGQYLYISCNFADPRMGIAKLRIPSIGSRASVVSPCQGLTRADVEKIIPGWSAGQPTIGGILEQGGRVVVSAFGSYDANGVAIASHWSGTSLTNLSGPFSGTVSPGLVKGYMGTIPVEWRSVLGGSAFAAAGYTSIISRQSDGATFTVFDPSSVTSNNFPMKMLLGCPHSVASCQTWTNWGPSSNDYQGAELAGGGFIVPGTRTFVAVEREASGTIPPGGSVPYEGYGYTTNDLSLHGQPYPSPEGVRYIYSLSDPANQKGNKGYPYRLVAKLYDLADMVAVKNGTKNPWDIKQYATVDMPASSPNEVVTSGAFNPTTGDFYLLRYSGGGVNTIYVYGGFGSGGGTSGGDTISPSVSISSPTSGSKLSSTVIVSADATDNVGVAGVQFKLDGVNLGSEDTSAPYSVSWDTKTATNNSHTLTAVARDWSGNTTTSGSVSVTVTNTTVQSPTADIKANGSDGPISVPSTNGVNLTWTSTNATSCSVNPGGYAGLSGSQTTAAIEAGRTFVLTCTGAGGTITDSVVVNPGSTADTTKPTVNLTAPTSFTVLAGIPVFMSADATDDVGVVGVQFKVDGVNVGSEDTISPYSTMWDTTNVGEGSHILTATARDAAGNTQTSSSVTVIVTKPDTGDTTKPTVNITSPSYNEEVSGSITIGADASDNVGVSGVQFKLNGLDLNSEDNIAPYSTVWNTETVPNGTHTLTATARDAAGNIQNSSSILVRVENVGEDTLVVPPEVELTNPNSGSNLSGIVSISANAYDDKGIAGVQFKLDGVNILPEDTIAPYSVSWDTKTASNGTHTITATARDIEGNQTTSDGRIITISNSNPTSGLKIGDKVKTTAWVNVRRTPGGVRLGSQRTGRTGVIIDGPGYARNLLWWKVNFATGVDGWVASDYLTKTTVAMTDEDYRQNIANIYLIIKYLQERIRVGN